jgi:transposase InsO family protein
MMKRFASYWPVKDLAQWLLIPRRTFYYRAHPGPRGKRPTTHTLHNEVLVPNEMVLNFVRDFFVAEPYCAYGYDMMTDELRKGGFIINKKKTYRLMNEHHLLTGKVIRSSGKRKWVTYRRINAVKPMEYLSLDIKYVWVSGEHRWYYLLSIMDIHSRKILTHIFKQSVRHGDVMKMFRMLHLRFNLKGVIIRNDNGSQFLANKLRALLIQLEAQQEFTHVATPEENAYIEAFHSILDRELIQRFEFTSYYDAKQEIERYMLWYNDRRRHREIGRLTPNQMWAQAQWWSYDKQSGNGSAVPLSRPADWPLRTSLDKVTADPYFGLSVDQHGTLLQNQIENSVQILGG